MIDRNAYYGGAKRTVISSGNPLNVLPKAARVWTLAGADATCFFQLPDARTLSVGHPIYLVSEGFNYLVKDGAGNVLFTASGVFKGVVVKNTTAAGLWRWRGPLVLPTVSVAPSLWLRSDAGVYDADTGGALIIVDATGIGRWEDQSANGFHVIQATGGNRPLLKLNILNGFPAVRWDGSDDALRRNPFTITDLSGGSGGSEDLITIFSVHKVTTAQNQRILSCSSGGNELSVRPAEGDGKIHFYVDSGSNLNVNTPGGYVNSWRTDVYTRNGTTATIRSNGTQIATGSVSSLDFGGAGALSIGAYDVGVETMAGDSTELIVYPGALSLGDTQGIEGYLRSRYAHY